MKSYVWDEKAASKSIDAAMMAAIQYFRVKVFDHLPTTIDLKQCWTAGGCVRDFFTLGFVTNDIDLFFQKEIDAVTAVEALIGEPDWTELYTSANGTMFQRGKTKLHVITGFTHPHGMGDCIDNFDFTVCCAAVSNFSVVHHERFFLDLARKTLVINSLPKPASTLERLQKYITKGYRICNGGFLELAKALQSTDLDNEDQNTLSYYPDGTIRFVGLD